MMDEVFIEYTLQKGRSAKVRVAEAFAGLSVEQFNWKPLPQSWSIAQCLEHLVISDSAYFSTLQKIAAGNYQQTFWGKNSPFTHLFGKILKDRLQEQSRRKMVTHKKLKPAGSIKHVDFIDRYLQNLETFLVYISNCRHIDLDKTILTSPTIRMITYSLRDALQFLLEHEHRHIGQAIRIRDNINCPKQ